MICDLHDVVDLDQRVSLMGTRAVVPGGVNVCDPCMKAMKKRLSRKKKRTDFGVRLCTVPWEHIVPIS